MILIYDEIQKSNKSKLFDLFVAIVESIRIDSDRILLNQQTEIEDATLQLNGWP